MRFDQLVYTIVGYLSGIFPILVGLILVTMLFGLVKFIFSLNGAKDYEQGKQVLIAGFIALFVILTLWGLVSFTIALLGDLGN